MRPVFLLLLRADRATTCRQTRKFQVSDSTPYVLCCLSEVPSEYSQSKKRREATTSHVATSLTSRAGDSRCRALSASSNLGEGAYFLAYMEGLFTPRMPTFRASPLVEGPASSARPHSLRRAARRPTGLHGGKRSAENLNWGGGGFTCGWCPRIQGSSRWDSGASLFGTDDPAIPFNSGCSALHPRVLQLMQLRLTSTG